MYKLGQKEVTNARDLYTRRNEGSCIWVVKSEYIVSSESEDGETLTHLMIKCITSDLLQHMKAILKNEFTKLHIKIADSSLISGQD